jgi:hypothetical protein
VSVIVGATMFGLGMQLGGGCGSGTLFTVGGGSARMIEISKRENFYQQEYCGCIYSLRDTNRHRRAQGREAIEIGVKFYGREETL